MPAAPTTAPTTTATTTRRGRRPLQAPANIPRFTLFGETGGAADDLLHVETLASRSRQYHGEISAHVHTGHHQLLWLRQGEVTLALDESRSVQQAPVALVVPPGVVHAFRFAAGSDGHVLTLHPRALVEAEPDAAALQALFNRPRQLPLRADDPATARLDGLFRQLQTEADAPGPAGGPVPLWLARAVVWLLARAATLHDRHDALPAGAARQAALHTRFLSLVEAHHLAHWPVQRYARQLGASTDRLNRVTQAHAGRSALQLVHERLLREACRRLAYLPVPVSQLAFELGFDDPAYFTRFFKRHTGQSPGAWRAAAQAAAAA